MAIRLTRGQLRGLIREEARRAQKPVVVTRKMLRRLMKEVTDPSAHLNTITPTDLQQIAPEALSMIGQPDQPEAEELDMMWVMQSPPVMVRAGSEEDYNTDEEWTETNEPELAAWLSDEWDQHAVNGVVILCGSYDDEYGWFWSNGLQKWVTYAF